MIDGILNKDDSWSLMNSINHYMSIQHQEKLSQIISEEEMVYIKTFNLTPFKDGNQWCVLLGGNLQDGICGFGDTPILSVLDFNRNFRTLKIQ